MLQRNVFYLTLREFQCSLIREYCFHEIKRLELILNPCHHNQKTVYIMLLWHISYIDGGIRAMEARA